MKRLFLLATMFMVMLTLSHPGYASDEEYHYGFVLTCGQTVYRTFDHELSADELLQWSDFFENTICGDVAPGEGEIL